MSDIRGRAMKKVAPQVTSTTAIRIKARSEERSGPDKSRFQTRPALWTDAMSDIRGTDKTTSRLKQRMPQKLQKQRKVGRS